MLVLEGLPSKVHHCIEVRVSSEGEITVLDFIMTELNEKNVTDNVKKEEEVL